MKDLKDSDREEVMRDIRRVMTRISKLSDEVHARWPENQAHYRLNKSWRILEEAVDLLR